MPGVNHDSSVHKRVKIGPDARCPIVKGRNKSEIPSRQPHLFCVVHRQLPSFLFHPTCSCINLVHPQTTGSTTTMNRLVLGLISLACGAFAAGPAVEFRLEDAMPEGNVLGLKFQSRITLPYGPDKYQRVPPQADTDQPYAGYGAGMSAAEYIVYDHEQQYLYSMSDEGYIIVVDYKDPLKPKLTEHSFPANSNSLGSIAICVEQKRLLVALEKDGKLDVYRTLQRNSTSDGIPFVRSLLAGNNPKSVLPNSDCTTVAIGNINDGEGLSQGGITVVRDFLSDDFVNAIQIDLDFAQWTDEYLLRRGLNMPLTKNALEYWDLYSDDADDLDFTDVRESYRPATFLEPEFLAWSDPCESELLVNMQENNGLVRINMTDLRPVAVAGYGLLDHSVVPIDVNEDDEACNLRTYGSLFSMRNPDTIQGIRFSNGLHYVVTANEGGGKDYGDWSEDEKAHKIFKDDKMKLDNMITPEILFDENNPSDGHSSVFNRDACLEEDLCIDKVELSLGSYAIDYESDPQEPIFHRMVLFGSRGFSIFQLPDDPEDSLKLVFDSADAFERQGCANFPWSHNSKVDDEYAPITGANNTLFKKLNATDPDDTKDMVEKNDPEEDGCEDQGDGTPGSCPLSQQIDAESDKDGPAIENVIVGTACGRLVAAMAAEKSSIAMLFDITKINSPELIQVFHLSPSLENKSLGLSYNDGDIGEVDPESAVFLSAERSPSGKEGILWAGAQSGTVSFCEFDCKEAPPSASEESTGRRLRARS